MSHGTYRERNGLGYYDNVTQGRRPSAARVAAVGAWFAVWRALTPRQQAAWRALTKEQQEQTKDLDAADFAAVMNS